MQDIAEKLMAFSQQGPRTVCILSANGAICNVTLRQPAISGGAVTYEVLLMFIYDWFEHYLCLTDMKWNLFIASKNSRPWNVALWDGQNVST